jgi:hypothetical protein
VSTWPGATALKRMLFFAYFAKKTLRLFMTRCGPIHPGRRNGTPVLVWAGAGMEASGSGKVVKELESRGLRPPAAHIPEPSRHFPK